MKTSSFTFGRKSFALSLFLGLILAWALTPVAPIVQAQVVDIKFTDDGIKLGADTPMTDDDLGDFCEDEGYLFGIFPPWHRGLDCGTGSSSQIDLRQEFNSHDKTKIIVANITSILSRLAGLVAVVALIVAGFKYALSNANPQKTSGALKSIIHGLAGLAVAVAATLIVETIHRRLTGDPAAGQTGLPTAEVSITDTIGFVMMILALVSTLMIVLQGIRYALSRGNSEKTASARNGIIYSLVGMVVALTSWSMVQFVLGKVVTSGDADTAAGAGSLIGSVIGVLVFIVGVISVIMVIIGSYQYVFSGGDSQKASSARGTIIYSLIGVVIAIVSGPVLAWILQRI